MLNKVLIIALNEKWVGISRLPSGLERANFQVYALCPKKSFLAKTKFLKKSIMYPTYTYSRSKLVYLWMVYSILYFKPDIIIPGDEDAILALHNLSNLLEKIPFLNMISKLIRNSLAPKTFDSTILNKSVFQERCKEWGLKTPKNIVIDNIQNALKSALEMGYPVVLKNDSGYGGTGVFICRNEVELKNNFHRSKQITFKLKLKMKFKKLLFVSIFETDNKISLQKYIEGIVGQAPFCAKSGTVFAFNPMLKLRTFPGETGPASVSQGFEHNDIEEVVRVVAKNLSFTGFGSVEYMIESKSGQLFIIELNPRPTPTCHFSNEIVANDLCDMFYRGLNSLPSGIRLFIPYTVAMFPGERKRDPKSPFLSENYHDIPHDDPQLLEALEN